MLSDTERSAVDGIFKKRIALTQLFKYFFVGATAALIDWLFYWILVNYGAVHYLLAAVISFNIATLVNYLLSVKWVFNSGRYSKYIEISLVFLVSLLGLLFNELFLYLFKEIFNLHFMISKVAATGIVFFWNYLSRKKLIFN
jgi:putative flippase GtrA